jgi:hypothetical protein
LLLITFEDEPSCLGRHGDWATSLAAEESAFSSRQGWGTKSLFLRPMCIGLGRARTQIPIINSRQGLKDFRFFRASGLSLASARLHVRWVPRSMYLESNQLGREADYSKGVVVPNFKNGRSYVGPGRARTQIPIINSRHGLKDFRFFRASGLSLASARFCVRWVPRSMYLELNQLGRDADYSKRVVVPNFKNNG